VTRVRAGGRRTDRHHRLAPLLLVATVIVVAWGIVATLHLVRADQRLRSGIDAAQGVRQELSSTDIAAGTASPQLTAAAHDFADAHADIDSDWLEPLHIVPIVRTQVRSVDALSGAAAGITSAGTTTLATAHAILDAPHDTPAERTDDILRLAATVATLEERVAGVSLGPDHQLIGTLAAKRDVFAQDLTTLQSGLIRARGATAALADLLTGPRSYLLAATNNAEMRSGAGMMLQAGTVTVRNGRLTLGAFGPTSGLVVRSSSVRPTGDLAARWGFEHPALDFRDLLLSPQFPPNAALAARMWRQRTGGRVDGVATVDVGALADLLAVTGPVELDGTSYTTTNVARQLLVTQYAGLDDGAANATRHERLGELAGLVFQAVESSHTSITALAQAFDDAANGRHIMVWAATPRVETDWVDAGVGGGLAGADVLLSLANQGANKLDPYQEISSVVSTARSDGAGGAPQTRVSVRVRIRNATPAGLSGYAAGGAAGDPPAREYVGALALDFPLRAGDDGVHGATIETAGPDYGSQVVAVRIVVPRGQTRTVTFTFTLLGASGTLEVLPSARLPPTAWTYRPRVGTPVRFDDGMTHAVTW
jgi:hypothetical protein